MVYEIETSEPWSPGGGPWKNSWAMLGPDEEPRKPIELNFKEEIEKMTGHSWIDNCLLKKRRSCGLWNVYFNPSSQQIQSRVWRRLLLHVLVHVLFDLLSGGSGLSTFIALSKGLLEICFHIQHLVLVLAETQVVNIGSSCFEFAKCLGEVAIAHEEVQDQNGLWLWSYTGQSRCQECLASWWSDLPVLGSSMHAVTNIHWCGQGVIRHGFHFSHVFGRQLLHFRGALISPQVACKPRVLRQLPREKEKQNDQDTPSASSRGRLACWRKASGTASPTHGSMRPASAAELALPKRPCPWSSWKSASWSKLLISSARSRPMPALCLLLGNLLEAWGKERCSSSRPECTCPRHWHLAVGKLPV